MRTYWLLIQEKHMHFLLKLDEIIIFTVETVTSTAQLQPQIFSRSIDPAHCGELKGLVPEVIYNFFYRCFYHKT